ncbi:hypothetical protein AB6A40_004740 [Gnathostoma spinigerum]|uniref:Uncharacterized protein n=1 Tax=Gnathostoma spinigerum TaxID=75299 RepID=A0ABD6EFP6_9BILA
MRGEIFGRGTRQMNGTRMCNERCCHINVQKSDESNRSEDISTMNSGNNKGYCEHHCVDETARKRTNST